jgi:tetratricopeptide (TPR) repeat protein
MGLYPKSAQEYAAILELLVETDPSRSEYLNSLGRVMLEKGRLERAEDSFKHVHEQDPSDVAALSGLVDAMLRLGKKNAVLPYLEQLHRLQPEDLAVHRKLAMLVYDLGLYEQARGLLVPLAELQGAAGDILARTAQTLELFGQFVTAAQYWQRVLTIEPDHQQARMRLAEILEGSGHHQEALTHLLALYRQDGSDTGLGLRIGRLYEKTGQAARALPYYETYLQEQTVDVEVLRAVVRIQAALGNKDKTLAALEKYFRVKKNSGPEDLKLAAQLYDAAGRLHEAIPLYRQLIESSPDNQELLAALASLGGTGMRYLSGST